MITAVPRRLVLSALVLLGLASTVYAGVFKGHPYHDPHASIPSRAATAGAPTRLPQGHDAPCECLSSTESGTGASGAGAGRCSNCPPVTNALLRVWASDDAEVFVNGVKTKPQYLAGVHRGSRLYSLTDLKPGQMHAAEVRVVGANGQRTEQLQVRAGETYDVRLTNLAPTAFAIVEHFRPLDAWVQYDGQLNVVKFEFDSATTRSMLRFQEQSGAFAQRPRVDVLFKYYFTLQVPDRAQPGGFRDDETFAILEGKTTFRNGVSNEPFFDKSRAGEHLSASFKEQIEKKWLHRYQGYRIKVGITATLPHTPEQEVGPAGNPLTINVHKR